MSSRYPCPGHPPPPKPTPLLEYKFSGPLWSRGEGSGLFIDGIRPCRHISGPRNGTDDQEDLSGGATTATILPSTPDRSGGCPPGVPTWERVVHGRPAPPAPGVTVGSTTPSIAGVAVQGQGAGRGTPGGRGAGKRTGLAVRAPPISGAVTGQHRALLERSEPRTRLPGLWEPGLTHLLRRHTTGTVTSLTRPDSPPPSPVATRSTANSSRQDTRETGHRKRKEQFVFFSHQ